LPGFEFDSKLVIMQPQEPVTLTRDCDAAVIPIGTKVTLQKGEQAHITQALGGSYTVIVNGNMFRVDGKDADALGIDIAAPSNSTGEVAPATPEQLEKNIWEQMRTCYDPEIPVNVVDLGLIYDCQIAPLPDQSGSRVDVKMTLTAPGCGMGEYLRQDIQNKLLSIEGVDDVNVELVWEPPWNQGMMSDAAKLQLGLY
jgi:probable FeS assembly SUF system protein SufT